MKNTSVVIVGAGPSGIAAATRLLENGVNNIIVLEAENRIGGRVNSVEFGGRIVDLGGQWCHGEENNIVYELVKDLDLLSSSTNSYDDYTFYDSSGNLADKSVTDKLVALCDSIARDDSKGSLEYESFGEYFVARYVYKI